TKACSSSLANSLSFFRALFLRSSFLISEATDFSYFSNARLSGEQRNTMFPHTTLITKNNA
ncbi:hypothetical protein, partial [Vibrio parahaemolyticus]|uniref:hypothetical protein n=1 Tax=Vibrio parahaemolyticus TaxID=670 RepID=UPI0027E51305